MMQSLYGMGAVVFAVISLSGYPAESTTPETLNTQEVFIQEFVEETDILLLDQRLEESIATLEASSTTQNSVSE